MSLSQQQFFTEIDLLILEGQDVLGTKWNPMDSGIISLSVRAVNR